MGFKPDKTMGTREIAWAFLLSCEAGWADYFDVRDASYDPETDRVHLARPAVLERAEGQLEIQRKVGSELEATLAKVEEDYSNRVGHLRHLLRERVSIPEVPEASAPEEVPEKAEEGKEAPSESASRPHHSTRRKHR